MRIITKFLLVAVASLALGQVWAQESLDSVEAGAKRDLASALERLSKVRAELRAGSVPLSREANALKQETRTLRASLEREQRAQDSRTLGLEALEGRVKAIEDENDYLGGLMSQFFQELRAQMTSAEQQRYEARIDAVRVQLESADVPKKDQYAAQIDTVRMGIDRLRERIGGVVYPGVAVVPSGRLAKGSFVELGPLSVFATEDGSEGGIVESHHALAPNATALSPAFNREVSALAANGSGTMQVDVTLGAALAIEGSKETVSEHVLKGGIWVWPIIFFAALATILAIYKAVSIYSIRQPSAAQLSAIVRKVREGKQEEALKDAQDLPWEFGPMVSEGVRCSDSEKELVEEVMYEKMLEAQPKVERFLAVIAVTAAVAPLLGLLGTVTGMINTFKMITLFGTGDASSLSGGISEALITTELGLVVAIPALVAHAMLNRKAQAIMANMEKLAVVFVNGLPRQRNV